MSFATTVISRTGAFEEAIIGSSVSTTAAAAIIIAPASALFLALIVIPATSP